MPHNNPHQRVASLRPKSEREQELDRIAADCVVAWQAAKDGEEHSRHFNQVENRGRAETVRMARETANYPQLPQIIVTQPVDVEAGYNDFMTRRYGLGGAEKQE
ncbi:hypothetical protein AAGQ96_13025 [Pantoea sp. MBD-2R]|uniref:hypothetical protein n=1 Tax=Pantoea sp. MBD-2R TaxID=3141540 RepID=UPI003182C205